MTSERYMTTTGTQGLEGTQGLSERESDEESRGMYINTAFHQP